MSRILLAYTKRCKFKRIGQKDYPCRPALADTTGFPKVRTDEERAT